MSPVEILMVVSVLLNGCLIVLCVIFWIAYKEAEKLFNEAAIVNQKLHARYIQYLESDISFIPDFDIAKAKDDDEGQKH